MKLVQLVGIDDLSMVGAPQAMLIGTLDDFHQPDAIVMDTAGCTKFQSMEANKLGLPTHVQSLMGDEGGNLWLGCSGGLFRIESERPIHVAKSGPWLDAKLPKQ